MKTTIHIDDIDKPLITEEFDLAFYDNDDCMTDLINYICGEFPDNTWAGGIIIDNIFYDENGANVYVSVYYEENF